MTSLYVSACTRESDKSTLAANLLRSPDIVSGSVPCEPLWNSESAALAYNRVIDRATADILIFTHSDVYFPRGWFARLIAELDALNMCDPNWAAAGLIGLTDYNQFAGRIWDTGLNRVIGVALEKPVRVAAFDEVVLILRRSSGLRFDPRLPDFHLYGADLLFTAEARGRSVYVLDLPILHNSKPIERLPPSFADSYKYLVNKWRARMPHPNIIVNLTRSPWTLLMRRARIRYKGLFRANTFNRIRLADPREKSIELGFE